MKSSNIKRKFRSAIFAASIKTPVAAIIVIFLVITAFIVMSRLWDYSLF